MSETESPETRASRPGYRDMMSYIVSSAAAGEVVALENYAEILPLMKTLDDKLQMLSQAEEESRHLRMLQGLGKNQGFVVVREQVEPEWRAVRSAFSEAVGRGDLISCLLIQEVMVETMAIVLYRVLSRPGSIDPATAKTCGAILRDEVEHLEGGIAMLKQLVAQSPEEALRALEWSHDRVMPELFSIATTECERLCGDLGVDCEALELASIEADLHDIRSDAADHYIENLDRIGFPTSRINEITASMSTFEAGAGEGSVSCC